MKHTEGDLYFLVYVIIILDYSTLCSRSAHEPEFVQNLYRMGGSGCHAHSPYESHSTTYEFSAQMRCLWPLCYVKST